jgi:hypothetical protein
LSRCDTPLARGEEEEAINFQLRRREDDFYSVVAFSANNE